jgi:phosphotriesterase-related protein
MNRRDAIRMLGTGAGLGMWAALRQQASEAAQAPRPLRGRPNFRRGAIVRTILKDVRPDELAHGATLFHEHISIYDPFPQWRPPLRTQQPPPYGADIDLMVNELNGTAKDGVSCIVNAGTRDLGYNVARLRTIAERSQVHIVLSGGFWTQPGYPPEIATQTEEQITAGLLRDAAAERWGAIGEIGSSMSMHVDERKVLRACCKAHLATGLPLFTHTPHQGCRSCGPEQLDIIESMGVDPRLVCIGHLSDITDDPKAEIHKALAKRGAFLGFDTVGRRISQPDSKKLEMVLALIDAGYEDHVLLSSDFADHPELKVNYGAGFGTAYVVFVPKMRHAGVKEETIRKITIDNPRRFLSFVPKT